MKTTAALICSAALLAAACSDNTTTPAKDPSTESTTTTSSSSTAANGTQAAMPASNGVSGPTSDGSYPMGNGKTPDVTTSAKSNTGSNMGSSSPSAMNNGASTPMTGTAPSTAAADANADNTKKNERDRKGSTLTAGDQGNGKDEVKITAAIRKQVVGSSMSFNAKNVKIITQGTKVTLRGPVKTDEEKAQIESLAKATAGVTDVDNQLEVKK